MSAWREGLYAEGVRVRIGRWRVEGRPIAILIDYKSLISQKDDVLKQMWEDYHVDSISGQWDYIEPVLFGYAAGMVIKSYVENFCTSTQKAVAHFHEWMTASGGLYLRKHSPYVATVFTTHATVTGRCIAGNGLPLYSDLHKFNADEIARRFNVTAKHSIEKMAALYHDAFLTVSEITANECKYLLGREVTGITPNGFENDFVWSDEELAAKRAEAVKQYLNSNNLGSGVNVTTDSSPANWDAVKELLSETCINDYRKIIAIIDDPSIKPADKNAEIRRRHPVEYNFMLSTWYPRLRVTDVTVDAPSRRPNVDEAKRMLRDDPSQLSLADIYMIALTYEKGSKEWNDIIILAVDTYPQSPEARVNAANVSMANGNYAKAAAYLQGVPSTMPEAMNSRGILAMSQGNYDEAMSLFRQAQQAGVSEATYNISLLRELMQLGK